MLSQIENSNSNFQPNKNIHASLFAMTTQVAHDIRSPVTALNALVANLPEVSEEKRQFLIEISARINSIANDLLEKAKTINQIPTQSVEEISLEEINPESVIKKVIAEKKMEYQSCKKIQFIYSASFEDVICQASESQLSRVLSNLINNAVEALQGQGRVHVQTRIESERFEILIEDNGQGIPSDVLEKLGRVPVSYAKQGSQSGNGIGVFHACNSIKAMSGQLSIESRLGQGTTIRITLPVMKKAA